MVRKPIVAGMFYEGDKDKLDEQITECFKSKFGPSELPVSKKGKKIIGVIAPHAGYQFSGPGQAWCYKEIGEAGFADVYVILGTSHIGFPKAAVLLEDFETPFGIVKVDEGFARSLISKGAVIEDRAAHSQEHSIEVQLPFLQFVNKDSLDKIRIVPIVVGSGADYEKLGKGIAATIKQLGKRVVLIVSSDFTHYGINYAYMPFSERVKENLEKLDKGAIEWIKKLDAWSFLNYIDETGATICGCHAIAGFIVACKELGAKKVRLEHYYNSGDVVGDYANAVGYASVVVE